MHLHTLLLVLALHIGLSLAILAQNHIMIGMEHMAKVEDASLAVDVDTDLAVHHFEQAVETADVEELKEVALLYLAHAHKKRGNATKALEVIQPILDRDDFWDRFTLFEKSEMVMLAAGAYRITGDVQQELEYLLEIVDRGHATVVTYESVLNHLDEPIVLDKGGPYFEQWLSDIKSLINQETQKESPTFSIIGRGHVALFTIYDYLASRSDLPEAQKDELADRAWEELKEGNFVIKHKYFADVPYDPAKEDHNLGALKMVFTPEMVNQFKGKRYVDDQGRRLIFVVGLPRSGSTLLEAILASHSQVAGIGENSMFNKNLPGFRNELVASRQPEKLVQKFGKLMIDESFNSPLNTEKKKVMVDKMLFNFNNIGFIELLLGDAKIVHIRKNKKSHFFSLYKKLFEKGTAPWCYDFQDLSHYYNYYNQLLDHWDEVLPGVVLHVNYEDLIQNTEETVRTVAKHVGLDFEPAMLEHHKKKKATLTTSAHQVSKPLTGKSLGSWKMYKDNLMTEMASCSTDE